MLESLAILIAAGVAVVLVLVMARAKLRAPGARRSRRDAPAGTADGQHRHDAGDGGDGGD
jgi:hypothetical protein